MVRRSLLLLPLVAAMLGACGGDPPQGAVGKPSELPDKPVPPVPLVDLVVDANRSGSLEPGVPDEDEGEESFSATAGAIFLANLDDDDSDGRSDAADEIVNGAADIEDLARLLMRAWPEAPDGTTGQLVLGEPESVRLFHVAGPQELPASYLALPPEPFVLDAEAIRSGAAFAIEGKSFVTSTADGAWDGAANLTLRLYDAEGTELGSDRVRLRVAPVLFQFNTAPTEAVYYSDGGLDTRYFARGIEAMTKAASVPLVALDLPGSSRDFDAWTQDFFDVGHSSMPGPGGVPVGMQVAVRSAQPDRPAGGIVDSHFAGPGWSTVFIYAGNWRSHAESHGYSMNSFGNWEVVPPYGDYPLGRNVWGSAERSGSRPDAAFVDFVRAQRVQPEIILDTSWLLVGHVDEVFSWVHADTDRGWRLLVADAALAREMLLVTQAEGHGEQLLFRGKSWVDWDRWVEVPAEVSIDALLADADIMAASQEAQLRTDEMLEILEAETELGADEITPMPFLYESMAGALVAHQPGTVNLLHVDAKVVIADPFGPLVDGVDIFRADLEERLGALGLDVYFTDNWDTYHRFLGEVHCGTNVSRRMDLRWWESGR